MTKLIPLFLIATAAFADKARIAEPLTPAEIQQLADARKQVAAAKERLRQAELDIKAAHGWVPAAAQTCQWAEVKLWRGEWALRTLHAACGEQPGQQPAQTESAARR